MPLPDILRVSKLSCGFPTTNSAVFAIPQLSLDTPFCLSLRTKGGFFALFCPNRMHLARINFYNLRISCFAKAVSLAMASFFAVRISDRLQRLDFA